MKKSNKTFKFLGAVIIVLGLGLIAFLLLNPNSDNGEVFFNNYVGNWKVLSHGGKVVDDEYITFDEKNMTDYISSEVYMSSTYNVDKDKLTLNDMSLSFKTNSKTDNYLTLIEDGTGNEWKLIRTAQGIKNNQAVDKEYLLGTWNVILHGGETTVEEEMKFEESKLTDIQKGKVYMECDYQWVDEYTLFVDKLNLTFKVYPISKTEMMMCEQETGYIWEFKK